MIPLVKIGAQVAMWGFGYLIADRAADAVEGVQPGNSALKVAAAGVALIAAAAVARKAKLI